MENRVKKYYAAGIVFTAVLGTLSHFFYQWSGENPLVAFFSPVNESTWEHMKLLFFPMLICSLFLSAQLREYLPSLPGALFFGNILGTMSIPVLFYTYSGILGRTVIAVDIAIFFAAVLTAWGTAWKLKESDRVYRCRMLLYGLTFLLFALFVFFTLRVPGLPLFQA